VKRLLTLTAAVVVMAVVVAACRQYLPSNRYLQLRQPSQATYSTRDARDKFNHARHASPLAAAHVTCVDCHRFDEKISASNEDAVRELSRAGLYPGGAPCHYCHTQSTRMATAPSACTTCHENLLALKPADHEVAWLKVHGSMAANNPTPCENCHRQSFCVDCHSRRDTIQTRVHDRNFRYFHSVQARANPMQCGTCHREDFCTNCHQQGK
jgi:Cytochrome c7 and related cytochrome c